MIIKDREVLLRCYNGIRNAAIRGNLIYGRTLIIAAPFIGEEVTLAYSPTSTALIVKSISIIRFILSSLSSLSEYTPPVA